MALVTLKELRIGFRGPALLDDVTCQIEAGERIGLLGRNGAGKTTLLKLLSGQVQPDHGQVWLAPETHVALLPQEVPRDIRGTVHDVVAAGIAAVDDDHEHRWQAEQRVERLLATMELIPSANFEVLSAGMKRRVLLARALVSAPDLLLLDEPTNHLDLTAIEWLEDFLARWKTTLIFVTHDRMFLRRLANRILEIDRGRLFAWSCDYDTFVRRKEAALAAEEQQNALFDKRLAEEEIWIRTGIKARRTRNEGRVRALEQMRRIRGERQEAMGRARFGIQESERTGVLVADVREIAFGFGERPVVAGFSTKILRGDKIGILGPNGAGKTTLLRVILGHLPPRTGSVRLGTNLQIAYFDQIREQLREEATVQDNVGDGYDTIPWNGGTRQIVGYLRDFLFSPERARTPVRFLSGGERNRVLLARLFAKPANVIVLDEPTNDLDSETLEVLEDRLVQFEGTVLLVSHDRMFLNNVVTSVIAFEETGVREYVGGYDDWVRQRKTSDLEANPKRKPSAKGSGGDSEARRGDSIRTEHRPSATSESLAQAVPTARRKLTYRERQEYESLPTLIEQCEAQIEALHTAMSQPEFYQQPGPHIASEQARLQELERQVAEAYVRWESLESRVY